MDENKAASQKEKEPFKKQLECIRDSGPFVTEIFKGVEAGEPAERLLLKAAECISMMTGDTMFYKEIYENMKAVYGEALFVEGAVEIKLEEIQDRLTHLRAAMERDNIEKGDRERIERSIQDNEQKMEALKKAINK